jgi:hypothetical protein
MEVDEDAEMDEETHVAQGTYSSTFLFAQHCTQKTNRPTSYDHNSSTLDVETKNIPALQSPDEPYG